MRRLDALDKKSEENFASLRAEMKADFTELRAEMNANNSMLTARIDTSIPQCKAIDPITRSPYLSSYNTVIFLCYSHPIMLHFSYDFVCIISHFITYSLS